MKGGKEGGRMSVPVPNMNKWETFHIAAAVIPSAVKFGRDCDCWPS